MRHLMFGLLPLILAGLGCAGLSGTTPVATQASGAAEPSPAVSPMLVSGEESLAGTYDVHIDLATLEAAVSQVEPRSAQAQPPQALTYDLDIDRFLTSDGFRITALETDVNGDLDITFRHAHPFPGANFAGAITSTNRSDLGYTGRLVVYANSASETIFDTAVLDPNFVIDPAGYVRVGTLLANNPGVNNTFPYLLLADESLDNRIGVSNGSNPLGNYDVLSAGWNRTNAGPSGDGWTGFDYLHGGQTIANHLRLSTEAVAAGDGNFRVAVLIKYTDPRGVGGRSMRFPPEPPLAVGFAYRLPFAALDGSVIEPPDEFRIQGDLGGTGRLDVDVRDWDAGAGVAADPDLSDESDVTLVPPGTAGAGELWLDLPEVFNNPTLIAVDGTGSGRAGDELHFGADLTTELEANSGPYLAGLMYVDPEDGTEDDSYHYGVDPFTLLPDSARALELRTYQVVPTVVFRDPPQITAVDVVGDISRQEVTFTATLTGSAPDEWLWEFGGGARPDPDTNPSPLVTILGPPGNYMGSLTVINPDGQDTFTFPFESIAQDIGLDMIVVRSGSTYPTLWPDLASWTQPDMAAWTDRYVNPIYFDAGFRIEPSLVTVRELNSPAIFTIDSESDYNAMWDAILPHNEQQVQFLIIDADNWAGFAGIMNDLDCAEDNVNRGCVVVCGLDLGFQAQVNAHELGHVFDLPHVRVTTPIIEENFNLMSYFTDSTVLSETAFRENATQNWCFLWQEQNHDQLGVSNWWVDTYILN